MAILTDNQGYIDSETYANNPGSNQVPDETHQEYEIGIKSFALSNIGGGIPPATVSVIETRTDDYPATAENVGLVWIRSDFVSPTIRSVVPAAGSTYQVATIPLT